MASDSLFRNIRWQRIILAGLIGIGIGWLILRWMPEHSNFVIAHLSDITDKFNNLTPQEKAAGAGLASGVAADAGMNYFKHKARVPSLGGENPMNFDAYDVLERGVKIYRAGPQGSREVNVEAARGMESIWGKFGLWIDLGGFLSVGGDMPTTGPRSPDTGEGSSIKGWFNFDWRH